MHSMPESMILTCRTSSNMLCCTQGHRVQLDLSKLDSFRVFPGQVLALRGTNPTGGCLIARQLLPLQLPPRAPSPSSHLQNITRDAGDDAPCKPEHTLCRAGMQIKSMQGFACYCADAAGLQPSKHSRQRLAICYVAMWESVWSVIEQACCYAISSATLSKLWSQSFFAAPNR